MDVEELIERARKAATASSAVQREMAEAKSLRQGDNPERRTDLYSWPTPEQTLEGQLAEALSRHKAAGEAMAEAISAFVTRWECGDQEAVSVANRMTDALTAWNSSGADRD